MRSPDLPRTTGYPLAGYPLAGYPLAGYPLNNSTNRAKFGTNSANSRRSTRTHDTRQAGTNPRQVGTKRDRPALPTVARGTVQKRGAGFGADTAARRGSLRPRSEPCSPPDTPAIRR